MPNNSPRPCFITFAECRLKAKVVVEHTCGMPSRRAYSLPQKATESATITSGPKALRELSAMSSNASVVSAISRVETSMSRATAPPLTAASLTSPTSQLTNRAPTASMASLKGGKL